MVSPTFTSGPSTLGWRSPRDSHRKNWRENPGPVLQKLWHIETTPFKKFMTNLRKWKKLAHVPSFPTFTVKPKRYRDKTQMSFIRETCIAFFRKWSVNFQIADTCTHCVPIFFLVLITEFYKEGKYDLDFKNPNSDPAKWVSVQSKTKKQKSTGIIIVTVRWDILILLNLTT